MLNYVQKNKNLQIQVKISIDVKLTYLTPSQMFLQAQLSCGHPLSSVTTPKGHDTAHSLIAQ